MTIRKVAKYTESYKEELNTKKFNRKSQYNSKSALHQKNYMTCTGVC